LNYLAHLFLTADDEDLLVGQMLGDFLEPGWKQMLPEAVQAGVRLHQQVDRFTDTHALFGVSRRRLPPPFRRYGGILIDVFYDHILARRWDAVSPREDLLTFVARAYATLERRHSDLTPRLQRTLPAIVRYDWLTAYREIDGIARALRGLSRRLTFENPMGEAAQFLERDYADYEQDFVGFFPELQKFVEANRPGPSRVIPE
jgi:acyl carrier protein phosphodiesterase